MADSQQCCTCSGTVGGQSCDSILRISNNVNTLTEVNGRYQTPVGQSYINIINDLEIVLSNVVNGLDITDYSSGGFTGSATGMPAYTGILDFPTDYIYTTNITNKASEFNPYALKFGISTCTSSITTSNQYISGYSEYKRYLRAIRCLYSVGFPKFDRNSAYDQENRLYKIIKSVLEKIRIYKPIKNAKYIYLYNFNSTGININKIKIRLSGSADNYITLNVSNISTSTLNTNIADGGGNTQLDTLIDTKQPTSGYKIVTAKEVGSYVKISLDNTVNISKLIIYSFNNGDNANQLKNCNILISDVNDFLLTDIPIDYIPEDKKNITFPYTYPVDNGESIYQIHLYDNKSKYTMNFYSYVSTLLGNSGNGSNFNDNGAKYLYVYQNPPTGNSIRLAEINVYNMMMKDVTSDIIIDASVYPTPSTAIPISRSYDKSLSFAATADMNCNTKFFRYTLDQQYVISKIQLKFNGNADNINFAILTKTYDTLYDSPITLDATNIALITGLSKLTIQTGPNLFNPDRIVNNGSNPSTCGDVPETYRFLEFDQSTCKTSPNFLNKCSIDGSTYLPGFKYRLNNSPSCYRLLQSCTGCLDIDTIASSNNKTEKCSDTTNYVTASFIRFKINKSTGNFLDLRNITYYTIDNINTGINMEHVYISNIGNRIDGFAYRTFNSNDNEIFIQCSFGINVEKKIYKLTANVMMKNSVEMTVYIIGKTNEVLYKEIISASKGFNETTSTPVEIKPYYQNLGLTLDPYIYIKMDNDNMMYSEDKNALKLVIKPDNSAEPWQYTPVPGIKYYKNINCYKPIKECVACLHHHNGPMPGFESYFEKCSNDWENKLCTCPTNYILNSSGNCIKCSDPNNLHVSSTVTSEPITNNCYCEKGYKNYNGSCLSCDDGTFNNLNIQSGSTSNPKGNCYCRQNYVPNNNDTSCVSCVALHGNSSTNPTNVKFPDGCYCEAGYTISGNTCVSCNNAANHTTASVTSQPTGNCYCVNGYISVNGVCRTCTDVHGSGATNINEPGATSFGDGCYCSSSQVLSGNLCKTCTDAYSISGTISALGYLAESPGQDTLGNNCACDSEYLFKNGKCVPCSQYDPNMTTDITEESVRNGCYCKTGYLYKDGKCTRCNSSLMPGLYDTPTYTLSFPIGTPFIPGYISYQSTHGGYNVTYAANQTIGNGCYCGNEYYADGKKCTKCPIGSSTNITIEPVLVTGSKNNNKTACYCNTDQGYYSAGITSGVCLSCVNGAFFSYNDDHSNKLGWRYPESNYKCACSSDPPVGSLGIYGSFAQMKPGLCGSRYGCMYRNHDDHDDYYYYDGSKC